jgi:aryl-alcohol dehydrogenase-like predicted oxidoreductase
MGDTRTNFLEDFMKTRRIGSLDVTPVGLGCNNFGWFLEDEAASGAVIDAAFDAGINFFDTADVYGDGKSEILLGKALRGRRNRAVIATKFGYTMGSFAGGAKPEYISTAVEGSLKRLGVDVIDLYLLHWPDPKTPLADTLGAMDELVKAGKVREIGCGNMTAAQLQEAVTVTRPGAARFVSVENELSLLNRAARTEVLPACERLRLAFLPYFPLASGLLTGKYRKGATPPEGARLTKGGEYFAGLLTDANLSLVEDLVSFASARGHTILELAFAWLLAHAPVASVIAGATSPAQVRANAAAAAWQLTPADLAEIDAILARPR